MREVKVRYADLPKYQNDDVENFIINKLKEANFDMKGTIEREESVDEHCMIFRQF